MRSKADPNAVRNVLSMIPNTQILIDAALTSAFVRGENHGQQVSATAGSPQRVCHRRNLRGDSQHEEHEAGELPWIAVVFVSVTLAYALGSAAHGEGFSAGKQSEI